MVNGWYAVEVIGVAVGAVGTAATAGISVFLIRRERDDRRRDEKERREAQAKKISLEVDPRGSSVIQHERVSLQRLATLYNCSESPIYDVRLRLAACAPDGTEYDSGEAFGPEVAPSRSIEHLLNAGAPWPPGEPQPKVVASVVADFTDQHGVRWRKTPGALTRLT